MDPLNELTFCKLCGDSTESELILTPGLPHYGKLVCCKCKSWRKWVGKPDSDPSKYRRPKTHQDLVEKYSPGHCELCLLPKDELDHRSVLEAHHVRPYKNDGDSTRENIWILCTGCHRLVHWMRKYVGRNEPTTGLVAEVAEGLTRAQDPARKDPF